MNRDVIKTSLSKPFTTESGHRFDQPEVAFKVWGELNEARDNAVLICHALTGHAAADEWFPGLIGDGAICNPEKHYIICVNVPGSCYGSIGPNTLNPETGAPWQSDFPEITIRDMVRFQQQLLDELNICGIEFVIGGSMGGMQALELAIMDPRVRSAIPIAMGKAHTPWAIGISHVQRQAIRNDPNWNEGYYEADHPPARGLATARMMAMLTYRSPADYENKFGREPQPDADMFQVESYLNYQGKKLVDRFDANSYIILSNAMDKHDVAYGRESCEEVLGKVKIPVLVIGVDTDILYPTNEQKELAELLKHGTYKEIQSSHGHDAFLIEFEQLNQIITSFISNKKKARTY
ncbi:MAG: homoserine O-acetyltransferase [Balneolaceae bacterium]